MGGGGGRMDLVMHILSHSNSRSVLGNFFFFFFFFFFV